MPEATRAQRALQTVEKFLCVGRWLGRNKVARRQVHGIYHRQVGGRVVSPHRGDGNANGIAPTPLNPDCPLGEIERVPPFVVSLSNRERPFDRLRANGFGAWDNLG